MQDNQTCFDERFSAWVQVGHYKEEPFAGSSTQQCMLYLMLQTHTLFIKKLMHFLSINKHLFTLHVCSTKPAKIKHWSLVKSRQSRQLNISFTDETHANAANKGTVLPIPSSHSPLLVCHGYGWVLPQLVIALERIKSFQHSQHHSYAEPRGALPLTNSKTFCQRPCLSVQGSHCSASSVSGDWCNPTVLMEKSCSASSILP